MLRGSLYHSSASSSQPGFYQRGFLRDDIPSSLGTSCCLKFVFGWGGWSCVFCLIKRHGLPDLQISYSVVKTVLVLRTDMSFVISAFARLKIRNEYTRNVF